MKTPLRNSTAVTPSAHLTEHIPRPPGPALGCALQATPTPPRAPCRGLPTSGRACFWWGHLGHRAPEAVSGAGMGPRGTSRKLGPTRGHVATKWRPRILPSHTRRHHRRSRGPSRRSPAEDRSHVGRWGGQEGTWQAPPFRRRDGNARRCCSVWRGGGAGAGVLGSPRLPGGSLADDPALVAQRTEPRPDCTPPGPGSQGLRKPSGVAQVSPRGDFLAGLGPPAGRRCQGKMVLGQEGERTWPRAAGGAGRDRATPPSQHAGARPRGRRDTPLPPPAWTSPNQGLRGDLASGSGAARTVQGA